jgi:hypothetical protein
MKKIYRLTLFFFLSLKFNGQSYGNIWQFANNVGLDFNSCVPTVLTNGANSSLTGEV